MASKKVVKVEEKKDVKHLDMEIYQYNNFVFGRVKELSEEFSKRKDIVLTENFKSPVCPLHCGSINSLQVNMATGNSFYGGGNPIWLYPKSYKPWVIQFTNTENAAVFIEGLKNAVDRINKCDWSGKENTTYPHGAPVQVM
jgi:hypothetical protein